MHMTRSLPLLSVGLATLPMMAATWITDTEAQWQSNRAAQKNLIFKNGMAEPSEQSASYTSKLQSYPQKH